MKISARWFAIFFILFSFRAQAQNSVSMGPVFVCNGTTVAAIYYTNGTFDASNKYMLQMAAPGSNTFKELSNIEFFTRNSSNYIRGTLPVDVTPGYGYRFRVTSSQPALQSAPGYDVQIVTGKPIIELSNGSLAINPYDEFLLNFKLTGAYGTFDIELNTGQKFALSIGTNSTSPYALRIDSSKTYRIVSANDQFCGAVETRGEAVVSVNTSGLKVLRTHPSIVCAGSPLVVEF
jgi:hypothetical protein